MFCRFLICASLGVVMTSARAEFILEASGIYYLHSSTFAATSSATEIVAGAFAGATFRKDFTIGVEYNYVSSRVDANSTGAGFTGATYGARLGWAMGRGRWFNFNAVYYPYVTGDLTENGSVSGNLTGWGYRAEIALTPSLTDSTYVGVKVAYRAIKFTSLVSPANQQTDVSYSDMDVFPAIVLGRRFD